jgi:hypothetical protein
MKKLKCPRCKKEIKNDDTFCMSCGNPLGNKKNIVSVINDDIEKVETIEEQDEVKSILYQDNENETEEKKININNKTSKDNKVSIIIILSVITLILLCLVLYFIFFEEEKKCDACNCPEPETKVEVQYVEKEPTVQYINFLGYRFSMPLDWNFEGEGQEYKFINGEENVYVVISSIDSIDYDTFVSADYQKVYLEELQTSSDISINRKEEKVKEEINYYIMEGLYDSYDYMIIVTKTDEGIFLTEAQFENNSVYTNKKQEVIDFALSYLKNNKI